MPDPAQYSSEEEFMSACVPTMMDEGRDQDHAVAACSSVLIEKFAVLSHWMCWRWRDGGSRSCAGGID
jgi:hypothetical protein